MKNVKHRSYLLGLLLAVCLALTVVPALSAPQSDGAPATAVSVNGVGPGYILDATFPYFLASTNARSATDPGGGDAVAAFDAATGVLTLQGYDGGIIYAYTAGETLTVDLKGTNKITVSSGTNALSHTGAGNIIITSADPANTLTINASSVTNLNAIDTFGGAGYGDVTITGKAKVTVNASSSSASVVSAIRAEHINVTGEASLTVTALSTSAADNNAFGLFANTASVINTAGEVMIDTSANTRDCCAFSGDLTLTAAAKLTLKWSGPTPFTYAFTYNPASFTVERPTANSEVYVPYVDATPPALSAGTVNRTSDTAATIGFTTDEAGTAYCLVLASGAAAPTKAAVKAGTSLGAVTAGSSTGKAITLTEGAKDVYVVVEDAAGNISAPLKIETAAWVPPAEDSGSDNTILIVAVIAVLALAIVGFVVYWFFLKKKP